MYIINISEDSHPSNDYHSNLTISRWWDDLQNPANVARISCHNGTNKLADGYDQSYLTACYSTFK
ncbi:MAG TPA: hypothetical protein ENH10_01445 [Bacteroidetes bacterium]|nr:hypothetical protein [Bacteroidota bacterium]HEX03810.1 hypothetical protein [Bacteroidota bacterium]